MFNNRKFCVINNAIAPKKFEFNEKHREEIRKEFGIEKEEILIGNIGRLSQQKNQTILLEIAKELIKKNVKFKIIIVGDGPLENELKLKREKYNLEKQVFFVNTRNDVYKFYSAFDLFVLPSIYEGLPVVSVEAQCNGLPCLFSNTITEEVKINDNIEFLPINCIEKWVEKISTLPKRLQENNKFKKSNYNIGVEAEMLYKRYKKCIKNEEK